MERVASAGAARAMLKAAEFDVMVLDLGLPDEDGLKLLQQLRQQGLEIPVLILTARDSVTDRVDGLQAGPTTTCSSHLTCASWLPACTPCCAGRRAQCQPDRAWPLSSIRAARDLLAASR